MREILRVDKVEWPISWEETRSLPLIRTQSSPLFSRQILRFPGPGGHWASPVVKKDKPDPIEVLVYSLPLSEIKMGWLI